MQTNATGQPCLKEKGKNMSQTADILRGADDIAAFLEGGDHALDGLVEQGADQLLQHPRAELEIDVEVDQADILMGDEDPVVVEVAERAVGVFHVDAVRTGQRHPAGEALPHHAEADDQVGPDDIPFPLAMPRGDAPGQKLGIALDFRYELEGFIS